jgi:hypothetical protein
MPDGELTNPSLGAWDHRVQRANPGCGYFGALWEGLGRQGLHGVPAPVPRDLGPSLARSSLCKSWGPYTYLPAVKLVDVYQGWSP